MYLVLERGRPRFPQGFTCPVVLGNYLCVLFGFDYTTFTFFGQTFQTILLPNKQSHLLIAPQPHVQCAYAHERGLDCSVFARRY